MTKSTLVSAPGKVLLAGGYLVLDPAYPGVVVCTSSRFYTLIQSRSSSDARPAVRVRSHQFVGAEWVYYVQTPSSESSTLALMQSKQSAEDKQAGKNPFVGLALLYSLLVASEKVGRPAVEEALKSGLEVFVLGDNDFYSQRDTLAAHGHDVSKPPSTQALRSLPPFTKQSCTIREVHKTGLGSSAAMTTSLVGALLVHLGAISASPSLNEIALVHNVSQLAHCAAQGKVGSGFDVSAATWGSQIFRRFDPAVLDGLMGGQVAVEGSETQTSPATLPALLPVLQPTNPLWRPSPLRASQNGQSSSNAAQSGHPTAAEGLADALASKQGSGDQMSQLLAQISEQQQGQDSSSASATSSSSDFFRPAPIALPPFTALALADVDAGSNTPSLVGQVMKWRKEKPEWAAQLYAILASANQTLADCLLSLSVAYAQNKSLYEEVIEWAATVPSAEWDKELKPGSQFSDEHRTLIKRLTDLKYALRSVRGGMRELGLRAGCPVEPDKMGRLIQASIDSAPGVLGGGVPGAGGFDALYLIHLVPPSSVGSKVTDERAQEAAAEASPARMGVEKVWSAWEGLSVGPLLSTAGSGSVGLRVLDVGQVAGVKEALGDWLKA
ncbi:phosphomevalonate kinase [Tilletia horrida]|uniref:phosphomevalonate kinase n=1 Tax=Tilletia horrida TaxID=155126 RepID=A0AAN6GVS9_9BASI|nr:phosphomevalonate kinase [Tilletia horrida]KAK0557367.1 phosphomevalonate kinase [Tilletia horrida]